MTTPVNDSPLRRDAELNRQRIILAAREVFAKHGIGAGLNDIARHAGVGVGTVYRRFPDKDVLVEAALRDQFDALIAVLDQGLVDEDPWNGLTTVIRHAVAANIADRGLRDVVFSSGVNRDQLSALRALVGERLEQLLERARARGSLRPEITVTDLIMLMLMLMEFGHRSAGTNPLAYRRYLDLIIGSLRSTRSTIEPLTETLSDADADSIAEHWSPPSR